jgi:hypothetical protein
VQNDLLQYQLDGAKETLTERERIRISKESCLQWRTMLSGMAARSGCLLHRRRHVHDEMHNNAMRRIQKLQRSLRDSYNTIKGFSRRRRRRRKTIISGV